MSVLPTAPAERRFCELVRRLAPHAASNAGSALAALNAVVRFRADVGYANPGREVVRIERRERLEVYVNRYVLAGLFGPLPEPFQELAARRAAAGDDATRAFLDLFNHRLNLLRFWLWARHEPGLAGIQPSQSALVRLAVGLCEGAVPCDAERADAARADVPLSAPAVVALAGLLRHSERSADVVQAVLRRLICRRLDVLPFRGGWVPISRDRHSLLGSASARLGRTSLLGTRAWDPGKGIELRLFSDNLEQFQSWLPRGAEHERLCALLRWLTRRQVDVHVVCWPPPVALESHLGTPDETRLGQTARLEAGSASTAPSPARFTIHAEAS